VRERCSVRRLAVLDGVSFPGSSSCASDFGQNISIQPFRTLEVSDLEI
jgi:hypothetical protein